MYIANQEKVNELNDARKKSIAERMRKPLERLAHNKGRLGRLSVRLDSFISRHEDKGKGVYSELKKYNEKKS